MAQMRGRRNRHSRSPLARAAATVLESALEDNIHDLRAADFLLGDEECGLKGKTRGQESVAAPGLK